MKLWDDIKKWATPYSDEDEDDYYEDDYEEDAPAEEHTDPFQEDEPAASAASYRRSSRRAAESASSYSSAVDQPRAGGRVVNISNASTQLQVVLVRPENFDCVSELAQELRERHALLLNLEKTDKNVARRLVDFLSGCAFALDGKIKKVATAAYLITPYNVEIVGDLAEKLENSGLYN